jgi:acyl-CoA reductase-like NAD-dependent aldehyde dehydrogenase
MIADDRASQARWDLPEPHEGVYIHGRWVASTGTGQIPVLDPATEQVIGSVAAGTADDVDRAVSAARSAFDGWSSTPVESRAKLVHEVAEALRARAGGLARLISREVGSPLAFSEATQVGLPVAVAGTMPDIVRSFAWEEPVGRSLVVREPIGVVGAITPWNYPLHQVVAKVVPAIAAGCTVVLKPSEVAPLSAHVLADVFDEVGLPPGVVNIVMGTGPVVGEAIASHPHVDMVSLTGSLAAGRRVGELGAATAKRVTLELGGKSANIVLDDVDIDHVIGDCVAQAFRNAGQNCSALSRLLVPRAALARVCEIAADVGTSFVVGDPLDPRTQMGPLVSAEHRERVRGYIRAGTAEGAVLLCGGLDPPEGLERGYFVRPTVFTEVTRAMRIAREEIFGPVLCVFGYDSQEEAISIANDSVYGLSGAVWSADPARAEQVARRLRTGRVVINGGPFNPAAPFGGYKQSGVGTELGAHGLEEFLLLKTLQR